MKTSKGRCDYTESRDKELRRAFIERLGKNGKMIKEVMAEMVDVPAPRFYINEERAYTYVRHLRRSGCPDEIRSPTLRRMLAVIVRRVDILMAFRPELSLREAVYEVVNSPAPSFFLSPLSIRTMLYA